MTMLKIGDWVDTPHGLGKVTGLSHVVVVKYPDGVELDYEHEAVSLHHTTAEELIEALYRLPAADRKKVRETMRRILESNE